MICELPQPHIHIGDCGVCRKHERIYFDGLCARCHERRIFGDVREPVTA